jgi:hypothetical protein
VVLSVVIGDIFGLPTTIRSMRTANIRAAFVVLADAKAANLIALSIPELISKCGVTVVNVGTLTKHQLKGRYRTRWHLVHDYLRANPLKFRRFTMTDAYDSFFQGDVFLSSVRDDSLYFSTESITVAECQHNSRWISEVFPSALSQISSHPIVCAGPIVGGIKPFLKLCELLFAIPEWAGHWATPPDQAYVNYAIRTGKLETARIRYNVVPNDGFITTVGYCNRKARLRVDENGNVGCPGFKTTPMLLHQYLRPRNMRAHMMAACPAANRSLFFKIEPYSREHF